MIEAVQLSIIRADTRCIACFGANNDAQRIGPSTNPEELLQSGLPRCYFRRAKTERSLTRLTPDPNNAGQYLGGPTDLVNAATIWVVQATSYQWLQWACRAIRLALHTNKAWQKNYALHLNPTDQAEVNNIWVANMVLADEQDADVAPFPGQGVTIQERWLTFSSQFKEDVN